VTNAPFTFLLVPQLCSMRNRVRRRQRGDLLRAGVFGGIGLAVCGALFVGAYWLTTKLAAFEEFGDYLLRLGLSWLFLTFLGFLAFSGVVASLSTFFLSEDLRLLVAAPIPRGRLFLARFTRTVAQASWMVAMFLTPVLLGVGAARCAPFTYYAAALLTVVPFATIPVALGAGATLLMVNVLPARRARDVLMLVSLLFAATLVLILRFIEPERLLRVESLPDIADFFANLQSPVMPLLPSFWAGESLFAELQGGRDLLHGAALWTTALACTVLLGTADRRWHFAGYSRSQESAKARVSQLRAIDAVARALPLSTVRRELVVKDVKVFLRDVNQWLQLLPLCALVLLYLYNFRTLDLERIPYMSGFLKNVYALVNLAMAGFVLATVAVRFVFPAVSAEGAAFWIVRASPVSLRDFLWSKFWTGLAPLLIFIEGLTIAANELMGVDPWLKVLAIVAIAFMTVAIVGLAVGFGARYPRFGADPTQAAGSYGGVSFMVLAVLYVIVMVALLGWPSSMWLFSRLRGIRMSSVRELLMIASLASAAALSVAIPWMAMRSGVVALERMRR
jgi:ABC-2 type transport system permease protein